MTTPVESPTIALTKAGGGGTGNRLAQALIAVCGVAALVACLLSFVSIWLQSKNYRKPLLQRYVIRILLMVPIYSLSSLGSLMSFTAAFYLDPIRDIYEAFTIYTFFQLLINFLGGERSLIIMMHGRPPVNHPWPLNHVLSRVDISDPHTFLAIKRGILQYAWLKPVLGLATIIMKSTGVYQEGYIGLSSGYLWLGILYNLSVTLSLYSLAMFWVCMSQDLQPFRPVPKFLCIKLIIFASYWQGFFLSILQFLNAIPSDVEGYSQDNLAAAIQDALISCEMPIFAVAHWYAFSWHDYADTTISAARMPVKFALRDAFGIRDLIEDTKETFGGKKYEYRSFDTRDNVITHEESDSRVARMMEGMRYTKDGKKYWIPKPGEASSRMPLLGESSQQGRSSSRNHGTLNEPNELDFGSIDREDERLYESARVLEFGDWNYPVITAHVPAEDQWRRDEPNLITTSTNRKLLDPAHTTKKRHERQIEERANKGKDRTSSSSGSGSKPKLPIVSGLIRQESTASAKSSESGNSQLVDLVVEDEEAEQTERVRARKEGGDKWNVDESKHFRRPHYEEEQLEAGASNFAVGDEEEEEDDKSDKAGKTGPYEDGAEERNVWNSERL